MKRKTVYFVLTDCRNPNGPINNPAIPLAFVYMDGAHFYDLLLALPSLLPIFFFFPTHILFFFCPRSKLTFRAFFVWHKKWISQAICNAYVQSSLCVHYFFSIFVIVGESKYCNCNFQNKVLTCSKEKMSTFETLLCLCFVFTFPYLSKESVSAENSGFRPSESGKLVI